MLNWWQRFWGGRRLSLGARGEREAARFLARSGYTILSRGLRTSLGELDLIARKGPLLVFVEVKTRATEMHGAAWEAVDLRKQRRVARAAVQYLHRRRLHQTAVRFDVVGVTWPDDASAAAVVEHFQDAFPAPSNWTL